MKKVTDPNKNPYYGAPRSVCVCARERTRALGFGLRHQRVVSASWGLIVKQKPSCSCSCSSWQAVHDKYLVRILMNLFVIAGELTA